MQVENKTYRWAAETVVNKREEKALVKIDTYKPGQFAELIDRIWLMEVHNEDVELLVPPSQYVNLVIPIGDCSYEREKSVVKEIQVEGGSLKSTKFRYSAGSRVMGVRFFAYGLYPFIQLQGNKILNQSITCPGGEAKRFDGDLSSPELVADLNRMLENWYVEKAEESIVPIRDFYRHYRWGGENVPIEQYCRDRQTNYSMLRRRFETIVGISPKKFERLVKFRKALCQLIDGDDKLSAVSADSGYFDQAHFIREFKLFLNATPSQYQAFISRAKKESGLVNYNFRLF
ncbi:AraC family transcriptional regulator [Mangrovibacterium marinum]|uniref:AraC-like DNA-binding protein n=1 Tax=Mangrovibacterium marinum TaxID=1639118 RepID=A0A2T5C1L2_9BACT|nr:AraC family transcriptional regulator [Mangrovibacterium marinum]PTN08502.1 AraC-like DNA-binding protein [Mangrovibacterium marinum]